MSQQYAGLTACINTEALEAWITRNTIIYDAGTDQEEHCWAPGAELAIRLLCNNLLSTGIADIVTISKKCCTCKVVKPISMFSKRLGSKDMLQYSCKECNKAANK